MAQVAQNRLEYRRSRGHCAWLPRLVEDQRPIVTQWLCIQLLNAQGQNVLDSNWAGGNVDLRQPAFADADIDSDVEVRRADSAWSGRVPVKPEQLARSSVGKCVEVRGDVRLPAVRRFDHCELLCNRERQGARAAEGHRVAGVEYERARLAIAEVPAADDHVCARNARQCPRDGAAVLFGGLGRASGRQGATASPRA